ncbi:MAG TPA: preprotein translocase subunit SecE [Alphaproteobacteria bacterium]|nr:preprotein translocase subunit SecE [Alphaproteobacteria bacterium]
MATRTTPAQFFRQVRQEVSKVTWPTRKETTITTAMVFVMVLLASLFFLGVDWVLGTIVDWLFVGTRTGI